MFLAYLRFNIKGKKAVASLQPFYYKVLSLLQRAAHFAKQAKVVTVSEKNVSNAPEIIAPIILVATNSMAKRTIDVKIVPRIPVKSTGSTVHIQPLLPTLFKTAVIIGVSAR